MTLAYLLSAALVLLGGYVELYGNGPPTSVVQAAGGAAFYQALLLLAMGYLHRGRQATREPLLLMGIVVAFSLDLPMVQQRFGWEEGAGRLVAIIGFAAAFFAVVTIAFVFRVRLASRAFGTLLAAVAFFRFGPVLLRGMSEPAWGLVPGYVLLGWLLSACLLPVLFMPTMGPWLDFADERIERVVVGASLCTALCHFFLAGISLDLRFHFTYLAPFVIVLGPALEKVVPSSELNGARRILLESLPFLGLALSALEPTQEMHAFGMEGPWTITPFDTSLALTILVVAAKARSTRRSELWHVAAGLACVAVLATNLDLPEVMARLLCAEDWQILAVASLVWGAILLRRDARPGAALALVAAIPTAGHVAALGYPFAAAFALALAWSALALGRVVAADPGRRLGLAPPLVLAGTPLLVLLFDRRSSVAFAVFLVQNAFGFLVGRWARMKALKTVSILSLTVGALCNAAFSIELPRVPIGSLLIHLGLAALLLGVLGSLFGNRLRERASALLRAASSAL